MSKFLLDSKVNAIHPNLTKKLSLQICKIKVGTQKIDRSKLDIFGMIIISFFIVKKEKKSCFFKKNFLLVDTYTDIALGMSFFTLSNLEIDFIYCNIYWKTYIVAKILLITRQVELIRMKKFIAITLDLEDRTFIVHIVSISSTDSDVYHS